MASVNDLLIAITNFVDGPDIISLVALLHVKIFFRLEARVISIRRAIREYILVVSFSRYSIDIIVAILNSWHPEMQSSIVDLNDYVVRRVKLKEKEIEVCTITVFTQLINELHSP